MQYVLMLTRSEHYRQLEPQRSSWETLHALHFVATTVAGAALLAQNLPSNLTCLRLQLNRCALRTFPQSLAAHIPQRCNEIYRLA
eukprot:715424-Amphidinium_carterae.1